jgi:8-oxo-dGTP pyrophosphatase MutT (NUDIX family)
LFEVLAEGSWLPGRVRLVRAAQSTRRIVSEVERLIEEAWARATRRPEVKLFDGPMCRLESFDALPSEFQLRVSPTSYKQFVGTNLSNRDLVEKFGREVFANPVGVSTLLQTSDGQLLMGRRNASVAYYPQRVHPIAGTIDPDDGDDPFNAVRRELAEEIRVTERDIADVRCVGLVEDTSLLQPELIFIASTGLSTHEVNQRVDQTEHHATWTCRASHSTVSEALRDPALTPVAVASLTLWLKQTPLVGA